LGRLTSPDMETRVLLTIILLYFHTSEAFFLQNLLELFKPKNVLKDFPDCGKRYERTQLEPKYGECMWDCEWVPNPLYTRGNPRFFTLNIPGGLADISQYLPSYIFSRLISYLIPYFGYIIPEAIDIFVTMPMVPRDFGCLSDCFIHGAFLDCATAVLEQQNLGNNNRYTFYNCYAFIYSNDYPSDTNLPSRKYTISRNYFDAAVEICLLTQIINPATNQPYLVDESGMTCGDFDFNFNQCTCYPNTTLTTTSTSTSTTTATTTIATTTITSATSTSSSDTTTDSSSLGGGRRNKNRRGKGKKGKKEKKVKNIGKKIKGKGKKNRKKNSSNKKDLLKNRRKSEKDGERLEGASIYPSDLNFVDGPTSAHHPWLCSLRTRGFRGRHRCGVTLLSGPTEDNPSQPWVIVGTAHCNYICKDRVTGDPLETCCCRPTDNDSSCKAKSPFCGSQPVFALAEPKDLVIVCGEFTTGVEILEQTTEPEQVLTIREIINHPRYQPNREGLGQGGPIEGYDLSVYRVETDFKLSATTQQNIWPVCLPKNDEEFTGRGLTDGFIAGWLDTPPVSQLDPLQLGVESNSFRGVRFNFLPRISRMKALDVCEDPEWQKNVGVNTFYPRGTSCFRDPSRASCVDFGSSGSGMVRQWRQYGVSQQQDGSMLPTYQYSLAGPLSMSKGCDEALEIRREETVLRDYIYRGSNPAVVTDLTCYMDWIAEQYKLRLDYDYKRKGSCSVSVGDRTDINKDECRTSNGRLCDWTKIGLNGEVHDTCRLFADEGIAKNVFQCIDSQNFFTTCSNNCRGVDPNNIVGAGVAAAVLTGFTSTAFLPSLMIGLGGAAAGAGGAMMLRTSCPRTQCSVGDRCCNILFNNGRPICPASC